MLHVEKGALSCQNLDRVEADDDDNCHKYIQDCHMRLSYQYSTQEVHPRDLLHWNKKILHCCLASKLLEFGREFSYVRRMSLEMEN